MPSLPAGPVSGDGRAFEPGSFRDPAGRVVVEGNEIHRLLSPGGAADWRAVRDTGLVDRLAAEGLVVATEEVNETTLRHEIVPFVSYPYEWTFSMLRDAALLQLDVLDRALAHDLTLKDATPYNIQFRGSKPVFIDVGSFRPLAPGEPWLAYRQFCNLFLFPLLFRARRNIPFQPWLRGSLEGIDVEVARRVLGGRDLLTPGVFLDVVLQARADRANAARGDDVRSGLAKAGFTKDLIVRNVRRLRSVVAELEWKTAGSPWADYAAEHDHVAAQRGVKEAFLDRVLAARRPATVWDLGANDGYFSSTAARTADYVLAADADELVLDRLYGRLSAGGLDNLQPLLFDVADPSPGLGWNGRERRRLEERSRPDLVLLFAVIHHLVIGKNLPPASVLDWLLTLGADIILEWVPPTDPMVRRITANKRPDEIHPDYTDAAFTALVEARFERRAVEEVEGRRLLWLAPRS